MRKLKGLSEITSIFLLVFISIFAVLKKIFVFKGEHLKDIIYKSDNLIVQTLKKGNKKHGKKIVVLGNGWNVSVVDKNDRVTKHDPFFLLPKAEVKLLEGRKDCEIITTYFPFECSGIEQASWELAQLLNDKYEGYEIILLGHSKSGVCFANCSKWLHADGENATIITVSSPYGGVKSDKENLQKLNEFQQWLYPKIIVSHRTNNDITIGSHFLMERADFSGLSTRNFYCVKSLLLEKTSLNPIEIALKWVDHKLDINGDGIVGFAEQTPPIEAKKEFVVKTSHQGSMQEAIKLLKKEGIL